MNWKEKFDKKYGVGPRTVVMVDTAKEFTAQIIEKLIEDCEIAFVEGTASSGTNSYNIKQQLKEKWLK